jgi:2-polyprenyl-3-methyl-5-hydroxy-6-metoxy-1,4-benzoquinol methylase
MPVTSDFNAVDHPKQFKAIPKDLLIRIDQGRKALPFFYYYHSFVPLRAYFWSRLKAAARMFPDDSGEKTVLDFGGGDGVFLLTLSRCFRTVHCLDLSVEYARQVLELCHLPNVVLNQNDACDQEYPDGYFDVIVASDVLEHFVQLTPIIDRLAKWLKPGGSLIVSAPMENSLQRFGRTLLRLVPPKDHYHSASQIECALQNKGFRAAERVLLPCSVFAFQLVAKMYFK